MACQKLVLYHIVYEISFIRVSSDIFIYSLHQKIRLKSYRLSQFFILQSIYHSGREVKMGQSKSCFVTKQTVCSQRSNSLHSPDNSHTSNLTSKLTLSSHVHSTTRVKLLSPAIVIDLRGRDIPIDSESRCSRRSFQCTESKNLYPKANLTSTIDDPHARIKICRA